MIRVGIIGAGKVCLRHANALHLNKDVKIQAVADIIKSRAEEIGNQFGAIPYSDYKKMIIDEDLDAVIINLPHKLHRESTIFCAERGLHTFVEKPMAVSGKDCEAMIEAAQKNNVILMIGHIQRYFPENIKAKELIQSGSLGKLVMITDVRNTLYFTDSRPKWFFDKEVSGGGILMNFGAHSLDKLKWLTDSNIKYITGKTENLEPKFNIDGNAQLFVKLENGVTAVMSFSGYNDIPINETTIYLTKGVIKLNTGKGISVSRSGEFEEVEINRKEDPFKIQIDSFINSVKYGLEPPISGDYGKEIIKAIESVYCS